MPGFTKTECPISREDFRRDAKDIPVSIQGVAKSAMPKEFATGSFGWNVNEKMTVEVGGKRVLVQVGLNITVIGSRTAKE
jgi:hypothetical protein